VKRTNEYHEPEFSDLLAHLGQPGYDAVSDKSHEFWFLEQHSEHVHKSFCGIVLNHRFFITKKGYIGMGPPDTQTGEQSRSSSAAKCHS
jgi:hypothetical protein